MFSSRIVSPFFLLSQDCSMGTSRWLHLSIAQDYALVGLCVCFLVVKLDHPCLCYFNILISTIFI